MLLFVVFVIIRQRQVRFMRNRPIISTVSRWQENGKPVFVKRISRGDILLFEKLTLRPAGNKVFEGYVPKAIQEKLTIGQNIYAESGSGSIIGSISGVSRDISLDTGMYYVKAAFEKPVDASDWIVVYVHTDTLRNVICVSENIIDRQDEKMYVWKVEGARAIKQEVKTGQHNGYGIVIPEGLNAGDIVVYKGFTQLSENDLVNIVKSTDNSGVGQ